MPSPTIMDDLAAQLADATTDRPGWHTADGSLRTDYIHGDWHAVVLTVGHGWQWTVWHGVQQRRRLDGPAAATATEAIDLAEQTMRHG